MTIAVPESLPAVADRPLPVIIPGSGSALSLRVRQGLSSPILWLAVITAAGAFLRFYKLLFPALWNDETLVFWRVCGTYREMLGPLRSDGFPPLHYSMYWLLGKPIPIPHAGTRAGLGLLVAALIWIASGAWLVGRNATAAVVAAWQFFLAVVLVGLICWIGPGWFFPFNPPDSTSPAQLSVTLSPFRMRWLVAFFGTLDIPATYFLARQMVSKRTSLVAAMITAGSAFMLFYSRDAKMYPDLWLMVTLNIGSLLWWVRLGGLTRWLCWIASGVAMVGLHASGLAIVALSLVYLVTARQFQWRKAALFLVGAVIIVAGLAGYMAKFNKWTENVEDVGWAASGIGWVDGFFNGERDGPDHWLYASSAFLTGYEWPRDDYLPDGDGYLPQQPINPALVDVPQKLFLVLAGLMLLAVIPWPRRWRGVRADDPDTEAPARVFWWIGCWVLVLAYVFYCRSVAGFVSPWFWVRWAVDYVGELGTAGFVAAVIGMIVIGTSDRDRQPTARRWGQKLIVAAALLATCQGLYAVLHVFGADAYLTGREWHSIWLPRYLGVIWPGVGVGVAALLMRLPGRPLRVAAVAFFLLVNVATAGFRQGLFTDIPGCKDWVLGTEPPIDKLAADEWASNDPADKTVRTYDDIRWGDIAVSGTNMGNNNIKIAGGRYYLKMDSTDYRPMSPSLFQQSLYGYELRQNVNLSVFQADVRRAPQLKKVIVWSQLMRDEILRYDPHGRYLGPQWKLASEQVYTVRIAWDWRERWRWVRREYVKR